MKKTTVQIGGMVSIFDDAGVENQIKRRELDCWQQRLLSTASAHFTDSGRRRTVNPRPAVASI
jgi:hypothetical protein